MPNWKKVIVSGSSPHFNNITASANISASGSISAESLIIEESSSIAKYTESTGEFSLTLNPLAEWDAIRLNRDGTPKPIIAEGDITVVGNISASGNLFISASDNSNIDFKTLMYDTATGKIFHTGSYGGGGGGGTFPFTGDAIITGSLIISASNTSQSLSVIGSGSTVFDVIGSQGTLFSIDDDLDGTIFTANDRSGLPSLEVSASGEVYIGKSPQSLYTTAVISSTTAATTQSIFRLSTSSYGGAFCDYTVQSGSDARAGSIMSVWNGSSINFTETTTLDIGDTTDFNIIVHISESQAQIASHASRAGYNIKTIIRSI